MEEMEKLFVIQEQLCEDFIKKLTMCGCNVIHGLFIIEHIRAELLAIKDRMRITADAKAQVEREEQDRVLDEAIEKAMKEEDPADYHTGFVPVNVDNKS